MRREKMSENIGTEVQCKKHESLYDAITSIDSLTNRLECLLFKIKEDPHPQSNPECDGGSVSLSELLCDGSNMINRRISDTHTIIANIENELF
jgi:hypothetical protein